MILWYIKHIAHLSLHIKPCSTDTLHAFTNADQVECPNDRCSNQEFCIFFDPNIVSWGSKKQSTIAHSSTEAEYKALPNTSAEIIWFQSLLKELHVFLPKPSTLWYDNLEATYLSVNPSYTHTQSTQKLIFTLCITELHPKLYYMLHSSPLRIRWLIYLPNDWCPTDSYSYGRVSPWFP